MKSITNHIYLLLLLMLPLVVGLPSASAQQKQQKQQMIQQPQRGFFMSDVSETSESSDLSVGDMKQEEIFFSNVLYFGNDNKAKKYLHQDSPEANATDSGRFANRKVTLPPLSGYNKITAVFTVEPIPKEDGRGYYDNYDKAGTLMVSPSGYEPIELVKFVTSFGLKRTFEVDITHLSPVLQGDCTFVAHMDTWVSPGFRVSFFLKYEVVSPEKMKNPPSKWVIPLLNKQGINYDNLSKGVYASMVNVPTNVNTIKLYYLVSGHGQNLENAGEFKSRLHVVKVNDFWKILQYSPWRIDGNKFRDINPLSGRWGRGNQQVWSSDFPRSGWMPGNMIKPKIVEITRNILPNGPNTFMFDIEDVKPRDSKGLEYWRVSAYLVGY